MAQLSLVLCNLDLTPIAQEWAIEQILSATIMMEEVDRFSPHSITVNASFRQNLALLTGMVAVQIVDADNGTIAFGLIDDPEEQITSEDVHTITLTLPNITEDLRFQTTGQGWVAGWLPPPGTQPIPRDGNGNTTNSISLATIVSRIAPMRHGWYSQCVGGFGQFPFVLKFEDMNLLGALIQTAEVTGAHCRQAKDANGTPLKLIEIERRIDGNDGQTVRLGDTINIVCGDQRACRRHVLHNYLGIAR